MSALSEENDESWRADAACKGVDPLLFFGPRVDGTRSEPGRPARVMKAKMICKSCPVLVECREWAIGNLEYGIAGGMTEKERQREYTLRRKAARNRGKEAG